MRIIKLSDFINESAANAKKILASKNIPLDNKTYNTIKELLSKSPAYIGMFTDFYFNQNVTLANLENLYELLKKYSKDLVNNAANYKSYQELINELSMLDSNKLVKKIYNELPKALKSNIDINDSEFNRLAIEISKIPNKGFFKNISKAKSYDDVIYLMSDFITKMNDGKTYDFMIQKIMSTPGAVLLFDEDKSNLILVRLETDKACNMLGSTNWCIVGENSSWFTYTSNPPKNQYIVYDFDKEWGSSRFMIGITVEYGGNISNMHDNNNGKISHLPAYLDILKPLLKGPSKDELKKRELDEAEKLVKEREQERLIWQAELNQMI